MLLRRAAFQLLAFSFNQCKFLPNEASSATAFLLVLFGSSEENPKKRPEKRFRNVNSSESSVMAQTSNAEWKKWAKSKNLFLIRSQGHHSESFCFVHHRHFRGYIVSAALLHRHALFSRKYSIIRVQTHEMNIMQ